MAKVMPRTLSGFMELQPSDQMKMERMMSALRDSYSLYGFTPLDTPVIESAEVLLAKGGGETEKQVYRFIKGDSDLALRFDLTVPLAKYVAAHYGEYLLYVRLRASGCVGRHEAQVYPSKRGKYKANNFRAYSKTICCAIRKAATVPGCKTAGESNPLRLPAGTHVTFGIYGTAIPLITSNPL